eukprot:scaffold165850_cov30-Prasinocladus_malaysianus.AAC.2
MLDTICVANIFAATSLSTHRLRRNRPTKLSIMVYLQLNKCCSQATDGSSHRGFCWQRLCGLALALARTFSTSLERSASWSLERFTSIPRPLDKLA